MSYVVIYLVNWTLIAVKSNFQIAVLKKRLKKQFFGAKYIFFGKRCSLRSQSYLIVFQTCWACRQELAPQFLSCMQNHIHRIWSWRLRVNKSAAAEGQLELVLPNWRGDVRVLVWQHYYYFTHTCISSRLFRVALDGAGLNAIRVPDSRLR